MTCDENFLCTSLMLIDNGECYSYYYTLQYIPVHERGWIIFESRVQVEFRVGIRVCGPPAPLTAIG